MGAQYIYIGQDFSTTDKFLTPGTTYHYYMLTGTSAGNTSSQPYTLTMPGSTLVDVPALDNVTVLGSDKVCLIYIVKSNQML